VLAVPVATPEIVQSLGFEVEHCVCLQAPSELYAIGVFYEDFREVSGDDVLRLLDRAWQERASETESVA